MFTETALAEIRVRQREHLSDTLLHGIRKESPELFHHSVNVSQYAKRIAVHAGADLHTQWMLEQIGKIHDIGKLDPKIKPLLAIPFSQKITPEQKDIFKQHAKVGAEMAMKAGISPAWAYVIETHHEDYDGGGYPNGLIRGEIPYAAQVLRIADSFAAITERKDSNIQLAKENILQGMGRQYNPYLAGPFETFIGTI